MSDEPLRLIDDPAVSKGLREDLEHAADAGLEGFDVVAGAAGLSAILASQATTVTAPATASSGLMAKVLAVVVVLGGGATAFFATRSEAPEASPSSPDAAASAVEKSATPTGDESGPVQTTKIEESPAAVIEVAPQPEAVASPRVAPQPGDASVEESGTATTLQRKTPRARTRPKRAKSIENIGDPFREARLIADARKALPRDPKRALSLLEEADRSFPRGMLTEEREALTIIALARVGSSEKASKRAERFLRRHGDGPYADAVRRALE